jgi:hypothetical protein
LRPTDPDTRRQYSTVGADATRSGLRPRPAPRVTGAVGMSSACIGSMIAIHATSARRPPSVAATRERRGAGPVRWPSWRPAHVKNLAQQERPSPSRGRRRADCANSQRVGRTVGTSRPSLGSWLLSRERSHRARVHARAQSFSSLDEDCSSSLSGNTQLAHETTAAGRQPGGASLEANECRRSVAVCL